MSKYDRVMKNKKGESIVVDVYDVLVAFRVDCPATAHAIKKALCPGERGEKSEKQDLEEAISSLYRAIDILSYCEALAGEE